MARMAMVAGEQPLDLPSWQQLCDRGPDLVLCLDFPKLSAGFATLASSSLVDARILHIRQSALGQRLASVDRLDTRARHWAREVLDTGRRVSAVLGHRAGSALATAVADAIAEAGRTPPAVVLFDATTVTGTRTGTPLFLSSRDHELAHERSISLDVDGGALLNDPEVIMLVADLLKAEQSWAS
jgi:hypothetical protein